jgi:hypothetical protein
MAKVYKNRFKLAFPDLEMPQPRYHTTLFIQTTEQEASQTGTTHHVTGDLVTGMQYQNRLESILPEWDEMFFEMQFLGYIEGGDIERLEGVLEALEPPGKQKAYNHQSGKTEQLRPEGGFYEVGESRPPMVKCTEWIEGQAIPALRSCGILKDK